MADTLDPSSTKGAGPGTGMENFQEKMEGASLLAKCDESVVEIAGRECHSSYNHFGQPFAKEGGH